MEIIRKIRNAFNGCRSQPPVVKERILASLDLMLPAEDD